MTTEAITDTGSARNRTIPVTSIEAQAILRRMLEMPVGDILTYDQIDTLIMGDIRKNRCPLDTARRVALHEHEMVFQTIRKQGIKRADDQEIIAGLEHQREKIRRQAGRALKTTVPVDINNLTPALRDRGNAATALLGIILVATGAPAVRRVYERCQQAQKTLELPDATKALFNLPR